MNRKSDRNDEKAIEGVPKKIEGKPVHSIHQKRVSITSVMNSMKHPEKLKEKDLSKELQHPTQQSKVEEKDRMIKELQQEILEKKLRNDMIQEAFSKRQESEQNLWDCARLVQVLVDGCKILARSSKSFKKSLLRTLLGVLRLGSKRGGKGTRMLLIWVIGWATHLFTFLSSTLIKK